jgi:DNA-binding CsgD family transcriptional regulator
VQLKKAMRLINAAPLTKFERKVLKYLLLNHDYGTVAELLETTPGAVRTARYKALKKLGGAP